MHLLNLLASCYFTGYSRNTRVDGSRRWWTDKRLVFTEFYWVDCLLGCAFWLWQVTQHTRTNRPRAYTCARTHTHTHTYTHEALWGLLPHTWHAIKHPSPLKRQWLNSYGDMIITYTQHRYTTYIITHSRHTCALNNDMFLFKFQRVSYQQRVCVRLSERHHTVEAVWR